MKSLSIICVILLFSVSVFSQDIDQKQSENKEPQVKTETRKEFDEDGNLSRYDSVYTWHWSGTGELSEELLKKFEKNFDQFEKFFHEDQLKLHGFNFNEENLEEMPFDKEKMDELHKRMKDLFNGEYDERIRKFIEEHKSEIDEIRYQIRESIPNRKKAI